MKFDPEDQADTLYLIHISGDVPVITETESGRKMFWLNNDGIKLLQKIGPDELLRMAGSTAIQYLVDDA